ncbi:MAG TPA: STAS domain-containing protein [Actinoplanes sp.]
MLSIVTQPDGDAVVRIRVTGEIDMGTAGQLNIAVRQALRVRPSEVLIDLGAVSFLDSSGIRALLIARQDGEGCAATVRVVNAREHVLRVLEITGVRALLECLPPASGDTPRWTA